MSLQKPPEEIHIQLKDVLQGLTHSTTTVSYVFEDDPVPVGTDGEEITILVDMSKDGKVPINVRSLSSSFAVSDFEWSIPAVSSEHATNLLISGASLDRTQLLKKSLNNVSEDKDNS
ncbi:hypothetical protein GGI25_002481 [Coemansia spiralis]|uniref:Uncharacterized protein n=2 Tax=Coemansia TaxID=4863 RepID=A0A9W8G3Q9_9FUNG|nr:hypothetical protein EDC05_000958 [Coemansia umbellata]KAJ2624766.1 hypothetical protein GGI26_001182 [Coemansia sp. RSA 1358]KAJ2678309.1 hypothetical protein GGI25_002481 [Coemansia spiralis]